jgi:hypothetical protein
VANTTVSVNTSLDPAAPDIAVDQIGSEVFQRVKTGWGPENTYNDTDDTTGKRLPVGGSLFTPWTAVDLGSGTDDEAVAAPATGLVFGGFSARETTTTAGAVFNIRAGIDNTGPILATISLAQSESTREWPTQLGIAATAGIWLERVSGNIQVVVYHRTVQV